jgi:hypothetical protein
MNGLAQSRPRWLTSANVVSTLALFLALTGGAYATGLLPKNSVGSKQLRKNAVTSAKLAADSVDSKKIADGSLQLKDFGVDQLPAGPKGDTGPGGTPALDVQSADVSVDPGGSAAATANCPAGENAVSGGAAIESANSGEAGVADSYPEGRTGWTAHGANFASAPKKMTVYVECTAAVQTGP